jgi:hypothetical protein
MSQFDGVRQVKEFYHCIIEEVIQNVTQSFVDDERSDETTLADLKHLWFQKLKTSHVYPG